MGTPIMQNRDDEMLSYPCGAGPEIGTMTAVGDGVMWIRMPLPFKLDHINLWAIRDGDGWAIVDTGMDTEATAVAWDVLLSGPMGGDFVTRVLVTHMHRDHVGMSGWLTRRLGCPLWMTRLEYLSCRIQGNAAAGQTWEHELGFYHRAGWNATALAQYGARVAGALNPMHRLPGSFRRLRDGETLTIGAHEWRVVVGNGHSPEHACLYCSALKLLISGDQVLPRISSNVSVFALEPEANPLQDWLDSLEKIRCEVPDDVLVLPAHNEPFRGLHRRLSQMAAEHQQGLQHMRTALLAPLRAVDIFPVLFTRHIDSRDLTLLGMATGESLAHLNYLIQRREVVVELDEDGVAWYRLVGQGAVDADDAVSST